MAWRASVGVEAPARGVSRGAAAGGGRGRRRSRRGCGTRRNRAGSMRRDFRLNATAVEFRSEIGDHVAIVGEVAHVDIVARNHYEYVAVEFESGALLHEAEERGAAAAYEVAQLRQVARYLAR